VDSTEIRVYGRQVVAKVEFHLGERFPRVGFIVTTDSRAAVRLYNKRGTAEPWIKESKQAVKMARLARPLRVGDWSLTSLQQRLVKTGGRLIKHARYYWLLLAEGHLTRRLFGAMLRRIEALPAPAG
jgi:hypothetical protein